MFLSMKRVMCLFLIITNSSIHYFSFTTSSSRNVPKNLFHTSQIEIFLISKQRCLKNVGLDFRFVRILPVCRDHGFRCGGPKDSMREQTDTTEDQRY